MWKRRLFFPTAAIALTVVACTDAPVAVETDLEPQFSRAGPLVHSARGGGGISHPVQQVLDAWRVVSFTAQEYADGTVSGQAQLKIMAVGFGSENPAITNYFQAEVLCLSVVGNTAWIGASIKSTSVPPNLGREVGWTVVDNGQGNAAAPDLISVTQNPPAGGPGFALGYCADKPDRELFELEAGDIQVQ